MNDLGVETVKKGILGSRNPGRNVADESGEPVHWEIMFTLFLIVFHR